MDDVSIWSQNWPWTPLPAKGPVSYVDSTCTLCPGGCGITVRKVGERAVKIEGRTGHPVNDGGICSLGLSGLQLLYDPTRVRTPLKRVGARGAGHWRPVSWEQALDDIAAQLGRLREDGLAHTIGCMVDRPQGTVAALFQRFMDAYGSPNFFWMPGVEDTFKQALTATCGVAARPGFDLAQADVVLSFGSGLLDGWGAPVHLLKTSRTWQTQKTRLIQIEPRLSRTAGKADPWLAIAPGTEATLALGLAHVIIAESLYNREFVDRYTFGFKDYSDKDRKKHSGFSSLVLENFAPATVAEVTGLSEDTIVELAHTFAAAQHPLAIGGQGAGRQSENLAEVAAITALNALMGNINMPGGLYAIDASEDFGWPRLARDAAAVAGLKQPRLDGAGSETHPATRQRVDQLATALLDHPAYPLNALLVHGANPAYTLPQTQAVASALASVPLIVSFSAYMDETTAMSDYVLPNHCYLERWEDVPAPSMWPSPMHGLTRPVVAARWNTRHAGDTLIRLTRKMDPVVAEAFPWKNYHECLVASMGPEWDNLKREGYECPTPYKPASWKTAFETPSRKFEFSNPAINALLTSPMVTAEGSVDDFPLLLVAYDTMRLSNGFVGGPPFLMKILEDTILKGNDGLVEINPRTAATLGLAEGRKAILTTPYAEVSVRVHLYNGIMPGVLALPRGLGHTAFNDYSAGKGVNFNQLIGPVDEPVSGLNAARGIRAKLTKV